MATRMQRSVAVGGAGHGGYVDVTQGLFQDQYLRDVYAYECKLWDRSQPCGRGHGVAAMRDRAASEWFACGVSLAWLISLNEEIDPHNLSRFHTILLLLPIMGSDGRGGVTTI